MCEYDTIYTTEAGRFAHACWCGEPIIYCPQTSSVSLSCYDDGHQRPEDWVDKKNKEFGRSYTKESIKRWMRNIRPDSLAKLYLFIYWWFSVYWMYLWFTTPDPEWWLYLGLVSHSLCCWYYWHDYCNEYDKRHYGKVMR